MGRKKTTETHFAKVVRPILAANKAAGLKPDSIRGLAWELGNGDGKRAKSYRRSLLRWMDNDQPGAITKPSTSSRKLVAEKLGIPPATLDEAAA